MILELQAFGTGVQRRVHSLGERLELASGGAHTCVLSEPPISPIQCADWRPPRAREEACQRVGIELQGVPRPSALHPSCSWVSTQSGFGGRMLAGGDALELWMAENPQHPPAHCPINDNVQLETAAVTTRFARATSSPAFVDPHPYYLPPHPPFQPAPCPRLQIMIQMTIGIPPQAAQGRSTPLPHRPRARMHGSIWDCWGVCPWAFEG